MPLGTPADNGAGIRLGESVGGKTAHMDRATAWRFINPPKAWSRGIVVDGTGARFVNESTYGATIGEAIVRQAGGSAWMILDDDLVRQAWRQIWPTKVLPFQWQLGALNMLFGKKKFRSIEAVCSHYGFDEIVLRSTLRAQSAAVQSGETDSFGKPASDLHELKLPLHIIDVSLGARLLPCTVLTMGGLIVNEETGQVKDDDGNDIGGLYAAGRTAVGIPSWLYMSGLSIADCIFSGLRVADHISREG
jgi:3-oxo-5alpha-steroid 4-dehydrogenase